MKQKKQHIVIVTSEFPPQPGGIGNHAYNLALHLYKSGSSVKVIADQRSLKGEEEVLFDASLPFSVSRIKRYRIRLIMYLKRILITFNSFKKSSTIIATGKFSLWNVAFCSLFFKNKTIAVIHGSEVNYKSFILKKSILIALKKIDKIIAVSNHTKSLVELDKEILVIPNGIDLSGWKIENSNIKSLKGNPVLTTVGRVSPRKGQLNVIKKLPELIKQFPELHYHCVGILGEAKAFLKVAESLNVSSHITFHGSVNDETLKQILNATDIFVMLSSESGTGDIEGFGIAILEANAMGVPAIGAKGCGIEDAINNYKSGILINNNTNQLKDAIVEIIKNIADYKKSSILWAHRHSWDNIINKYLTVILD